MFSLVYQAVPQTTAIAATPVSRASGKTSKAARGKSFLPDPQPQPFLVGPVVTATKTDNRGPGPDPAMAQPGDTITYTVTISNAGPGDATGVSFIDTIDANTTLVASSAVLAQDDDYNTIGNVNINVNTAGTGLLNNDKDITAGNNTGMTVVSYGAATGTEQGTINNSTPTAQGGSVTVTNANGTFTYDPPVGFTGTDTFKYKTSTAGGKTAIATARITITGRIWFINDAAGACTSSCDGRLSHPFQTLAAFQALNDNGVALTHPKTGDSIFLYENATSYTGPTTLLASQLLIGQDATASLISITGLTQPSGADPLPAMNTGAPATTITSAGNGIVLGSGNTLRGFTVGATTGTKISGTSFGTLTVGNTTLPDVTLSGNGQALNLTTGTFAATSGFVGVTTTSSTTSGLTLTGVAGTVTFGSTTVSGNNNECLITTSSTANINYGNTSCTGGANGVSLSGNTSGTRTFGTLSVSGGSGNAFSHSGGGGNVTVTGAATLSSGAPDTIVIQNAANGNLINFAGGATVTHSAAGGEAVQWSGTNTGATLTFATLAVNSTNSIGMNLSGGGTVNVTTAAGSSITATGNAANNGAAIIANGIAFNANFTTVSSTNGAFAGGNGVSLTSVTGTSILGGGTLTGATGATFLVNGGTASVTYTGGITQGNNAAAVSVSGGHNGTLTFNTGTISASNGTGLQFDNADGTYNFNGTNTLNGGDAGIDIQNGSAGTFGFSVNTTITNPSGIAYREDTSTPTVTYNGTITQNNGASAVSINAHTANSTTFNGGITASTGAANAITLTGNTNAAITFNGSVTTGGLSLTTSSGTGFNATGGGTITAIQNNTTIVNTISAGSGTGLNVSNTTIGGGGLTFRSIASGAGANNGITLDTTGASGGLTVTGNGTAASGGAISGKTGSDGSASSGIGIYLNSTSSVSLTRMNIQGCQNYGIRGNNVTGFTLDNSTVGTTSTNGTSNTADIDATGYNGEGSVRFYNLLGSATISNSSLDQGFAKTIAVANDTGTLNRLTITNCTVNQSLTAATASDALYVQSSSSATVNFTVNGASQFTATKQFHIDTSAQATSTMDIQINGGCVFSNSIDPVPAGGGSQFGASGTDSLVTFNINGNSFRHGSAGHAPLNNVGAQLIMGTVSGNGKFDGKILNNTFGVTGVAFSGAGNAADALRLFASGNQAGTTRVTGTKDTRYLVQGNTIKRYGEVGIQFNARQGNSILDATVLGNTINEPGAAAQGAFGAIWVNAGALGADTNTVNIAIGDANVGANKNTMQDSDPNNATDVFLDRGSCAGCASTLNVYRNGSTAGGSGEALIKQIMIDDNNATLDLTAGFTNGSPTVQSGLPPQPSLVGPPIELGLLNLTPASSTEPITAKLSEVKTQSFFVAVTGNAGGAQVTAPATTNLLAELANIARTSEVASQKVAQAPVQNSAITDQKSQAGDLKTAVTDQKTATNRANERKANHAVRARTAKPAPMSGETVGPVAVGTLHAGDSVQITFQVTVNTPYLGGANVSNQGTVSGSNFSSVLTDDPDVVGTSNPTLTPIQFSSLSINDIEVAEGAVGQRQAVFTVTVTPPSPGSISVHYQTADNSATAPSDYTAITDTVLNIPANAPTATITVLVNGDTTREPLQNFFVNLSNATGAQISDAQGICTIHDDVPVLADLDGDGLTDISVFAADNFWRAFNSSNGLARTPISWGVQTDVAVPGDYDGDGKTDLAVWRPSEGNWYVMKSSDSTNFAKGWGASTDKPVPADYDGDGKTDFAVFRPSEGNWYILQSSNNVTRVQGWGNSTDKLVPGDYDGDGKADVAVWRPSEGNWYIINSGGSGITIKQWGASTDIVVPGDYDGDGKTDLAVWRPSMQNWYIVNSATNTVTVRNWGASTDIPVPGDYDGDGKTDIAVFRPSEGNWYIISSNTGALVLKNLGLSTDLPLPKPYINH